MSTVIIRKGSTETPDAGWSRCVSIVSIGEQDYYVHPTPIQRFTLQPSVSFTTPVGDPQDFFPCTIINWRGDCFDSDDLRKSVSDFASRDDVWTPHFLAVIVLQGLKRVAVELGQDVTSVLVKDVATNLPIGPHAIRLSTNEVFPISRLVEDSHDTMIGGSITTECHPSSYEWLPLEKRIALPSRFCCRESPNRPLAGLRFAVKDVIDIAGLETGNGNRHYRSLYPARSATAPCVQRLLDAGAMLVGKAKTTQFAEGSVPLQWFDYIPPFNPRGDGYQSPSSSSAGSAAASAAYSWLDFTIGTDTGGSTRHPAGVCGVYGLRTSINAISTVGIYSVSLALDTLGVFARSPAVVEKAFRIMADSSPLLNDPIARTSFTLLYPIRARDAGNEDQWFPHPDESGTMTPAEACFETTIQRLETHLCCKRRVFSIDELWSQTHPAGLSANLDEATGWIYTILTTHQCVRDTIDPFIAAFKAKHNSRAPFIDPIVKARQEQGRRTTTLENDAAIKSAKLFGTWVNKHLLKPVQDNELPLLLFPLTAGRESYRDDPDHGSLFFSTFSTYSLSYLSGCVDCTVPVDEVKVLSRITDEEVDLPVSLSVLTPPGTDLRLLALLGELEAAGVLNPIKAGNSIFRK